LVLRFPFEVLVMSRDTKRGRGGGDGKSEEEMRWMYEGAKSSVNREDYLLGKKVDKHFEKYSDAVIRERKSTFDAIIRPKTEEDEPKCSNLNVNVIRNEDPLVAIRVKEERAKQEILDNPVKRLKFQKLLKKAYEKKMKKKLKKALLKQMRAEHEKNKTSSESDSDEWVEKDQDMTKTSDTAQSRDKRDTSDHSQRDRDSCTGESEEHRSHRKQLDSHIPEHLRKKPSSGNVDDDDDDDDNPEYSHSDSEEERKRKKYSGYGLIGGSQKPLQSSEDSRKRSTQEVKSTTNEDNRTKRSRREPISTEEIARRRNEMMENARWRDKERQRTVARSRDVDSKEEEQNASKPGASFIRPMLNRAVENLSVEQRIHSARQNVQRQHGHMDRNFARR